MAVRNDVPHHLAEFELHVMLAVARLGDDAYGASILREIDERTGRATSIGALYATLGRLGRKGLLRFEFSDPVPVPGGRARKYCRMTPAGQEAVTHAVRMLGNLLEGLSIEDCLVTAGPGGKDGP
jgi:DNA-binding PadR family transcriptional regulator